MSFLNTIFCSTRATTYFWSLWALIYCFHVTRGGGGACDIWIGSILHKINNTIIPWAGDPSENCACKNLVKNKHCISLRRLLKTRYAFFETNSAPILQTQSQLQIWLRSTHRTRPVYWNTTPGSPPPLLYSPLCFSTKLPRKFLPLPSSFIERGPQTPLPPKKKHQHLRKS